MNLKNKKFLIVIIIMIVGYGAFKYYKSGEVKREVQKRINSPQSPFKALKYSQECKRRV